MATSQNDPLLIHSNVMCPLCKTQYNAHSPCKCQKLHQYPILPYDGECVLCHEDIPQGHPHYTGGNPYPFSLKRKAEEEPEEVTISESEDEELSQESLHALHEYIGETIEKVLEERLPTLVNTWLNNHAESLTAKYFKGLSFSNTPIQRDLTQFPKPVSKPYVPPRKII